MGSNSFPTGDGGHVGGIVVMAIDAKGNAVPVDLLRALAGHAAIVTGKDPDECLKAICDFAGRDAS